MSIDDFAPGLERIQSSKWVPPPEPHKPYLPYKRGLTLKIHRHTPVEPFGLEYASYDGERQEITQNELFETTVADLCHAHPPMEGVTHFDQHRELEIIQPIEVKDGHGAQVFVCRLDGGSREYAAKVYDPLYYGFKDLMWPDMPRDVTYTADGDYTREATAYEYLEKRFFERLEMPAYFGSWTFDPPTDHNYSNAHTGDHTRPVRMILIEYVDGKTMLEINVARTPVEHRLNVLTRAMEAESVLRHVGLEHNDVTQRNILVCGYDSLTTAPTRVCLFDFNIAVIADRSRDVVENGLVPEKTRRPVSPIDLWWHAGVLEFGTWLPEHWEDQPKEWRRWVYEKYSNSEIFEPPLQRQLDDGEPPRPNDDGEPYQEASDEWVTTHMGVALSPVLGGKYTLQSLGVKMVLHGSPKRRRSDFEDDDVEYKLELPDIEAMPHNVGLPTKAGNWSSGSFSRDEKPPLRHLCICVNALDGAKKFYSSLETLGLRLVSDIEHDSSDSPNRTLHYGKGAFETVFSITECDDAAQRPGIGSCITFSASHRRQVDEFHAAAVMNGGTCDGKPCTRGTMLDPATYNAFVISPDGWRVEAFCTDSE
jgi:hypothetical protein